jgi:hypothetical protein
LDRLITIKLAVYDNAQPFVFVCDRLISGREVDDAKTRMPERSPTIRRDPVTLSIGTAMVEALGSFLDRPGWDRRTTGKNGHNSAHLLKLLPYATRNGMFQDVFARFCQRAIHLG